MISLARVRQIIREEIVRVASTINEADVVRRRGGETVIDPGVTERPKIRSITDITVTPDRALHLPPGSPFVGGKAYHDIYNMGVGEEDIHFKRKDKSTGEEKLMSRLADYKIKAGKLVIVPELFDLAGRDPSRAYGVAEVTTDIVNFPNKSKPGASVPLVNLRFPPGQRPEGSDGSAVYVSPAFLQVIRTDDAPEIRRNFEMQNRKPIRPDRPTVDSGEDRAREQARAARAQAQHDFGIRRR